MLTPRADVRAAGHGGRGLASLLADPAISAATSEPAFTGAISCDPDDFLTLTAADDAAFAAFMDTRLPDGATAMAPRPTTSLSPPPPFARAGGRSARPSRGGRHSSSSSRGGSLRRFLDAEPPTPAPSAELPLPAAEVLSLAGCAPAPVALHWARAPPTPAPSHRTS